MLMETVGRKQTDRRLALFDFDGTISKKDTTSDFIAYACGNKKALLGFLRLSPVFLRYNLRLISDHAAKEMSLAHYFRQWDRDAFIAAAKRYASEVLPTIIKPSALDRILWHKQNDHTVAVVTGSLEILLEDWCKDMGLDLIATGIDLSGAKLSGKLSTRNCYQAEKARRITEKYDLGKYAYIYAYGDSKGDREMLQLAHARFYNSFS